MKKYPQLIQHGSSYLYLVVFILVGNVGSQSCVLDSCYHKIFTDKTVQEEAAFTQRDVQTTTECVVVCDRRLQNECVGITFNKQTHTCAGYNVSIQSLTKQTQLGSVGYEKEDPGPLDCMDVWLRGERVSGVYTVRPRDGCKPINVFCEMTTNTSWLVIQRRFDGSVNFTRTWNEYTNGFGDLTKEFWLGNTNIYRLTRQRTYNLEIDLERFNGETRFAVYNNFSIDSEARNFTLHIGNVSGNAGDSLRIHDSHTFFTIDHEDDREFKCAQKFKGGWWYRYCHDTNLNGEYFPEEHQSEYGFGITWFGNSDWVSAYCSLKATAMKIQPVMNG